MTIRFLQTSDPSIYFDMFVATSATVREFCRCTGTTFEAFIGIKRGPAPWHATFNRIFMLDDLIQRGCQSWACYLDADAWINDLAFPIREYLQDKSEYAAILIPSGATANWWDVNAGVVFINLAHAAGRAIVEHWAAALDAAWPRIEPAANWQNDVPGDQALLHHVLNRNNMRAHVHLESPRLINSAQAKFIRQLVRNEPQEDFASRLRQIRQATHGVLRGGAADAESNFTDAEKSLAQNITHGIYKGLLRRPADGGATNGYYNIVLRHGPELGIEASIQQILRSPEFQRRNKRENGEP